MFSDREMRELTTVFLHDDSIRHRLRNVGIHLKRGLRTTLAAVGPTARGSGVAIDMRKSGYGAYDRLNVQVVTDSCGDCYSRWLSGQRSFSRPTDLIRQAVKKIPDGPIDIQVTGTRMGSISCGPSSPGRTDPLLKGMAPSSSRGPGSGPPTLTNIPPLIKICRVVTSPDVPVIVLSSILHQRTGAVMVQWHSLKWLKLHLQPSFNDHNNPTLRRQQKNAALRGRRHY